MSCPAAEEEEAEEEAEDGPEAVGADVAAGRAPTMAVGVE